VKAFIVLTGRIGKDAELKYTATGKAVTNISLAVDNRVKDGDEWKSETDWWKVTLWGSQAEGLQAYLTKGKIIQVQGKRVEIETYTAQDGTTRNNLKLTADDVTLLGGGNGQQQNAQPQAPQQPATPPAPKPPQQKPAANQPFPLDDIPPF